MKSVLLASYQKPINDTRMYEKFGRSIKDSGKYTVIIVGTPAQNTPSEEIQFIPLFSYKRLGASRLFAWIRFLRILQKYKPSIIVVSSWELLPAMALYKSDKKIYDIRENYIQNATFNPGKFKWLKKTIIKVFERFSNSANAYIVSDESYLNELNLNEDRTVLIRNTYRKPAFQHSRKPGNKFIFTGTISKAYGIYTAIDIVAALHDIEKTAELTIIGFCPLKEDRDKLVQLASVHSWITLTGIHHQVDHELILAEIQQANYGIISYEHHPHILSCTPTRLYEYLGEELPVLYTGQQTWKSIFEDYNAGLSINPDDFDPKETLSRLKETTFYGTTNSSHSWDYDSQKLIQFLEIF